MEALHYIQTVTNETPPERLFKHSQQSFYGTLRPNWLMNQGPGVVRRFNRNNKNERFVE